MYIESIVLPWDHLIHEKTWDPSTEQDHQYSSAMIMILGINRSLRKRPVNAR